MAKKREKLLDKLVKRDYINDLEEVLAKKKYKEEVKNLLLDIFYKIENSYKDYETVKKNTLTKEEYMGNIVKAIRDYCEIIEFVKPDRKQKTTVTIDKENKKIICYPIAKDLLYSIAKIQKCEDVVKEEDIILNKAITNLINIGNNINTIEPLRDFNGFSWDVSVLDIENFYYNIVYQDLILLVGNKLIDEWVNKHDIMVDYTDLFKEYLEKKYGKKISREILELLRTIAVLLELSINQEFKKEITEKRQQIETELDEMENKEKYLDNLSKQKKKIAKDIRNLDLILNDKEKLTEEYEERNKKLPLEQKIFSKRVLKQKLEEERNMLISNMQECNEKMNSKNFLQRQRILKQQIKYLELADLKDYKKEALEKIILLQKRVLQAISIRIGKAKNKEQIIKIIYEIRYFNMIPLDNARIMMQIPKLKKLIEEVEEKTSVKAYELKAKNEMCRNSNLNKQILQRVFSLKIIRLEDVYIKFIIEKDGIFVQFYDDDITDEKLRLDFDWKKEGLKIKLNKKIKIFI